MEIKFNKAFITKEAVRMLTFLYLTDFTHHVAFSKVLFHVRIMQKQFIIPPPFYSGYKSVIVLIVV